MGRFAIARAEHPRTPSKVEQTYSIFARRLCPEVAALSEIVKPLGRRPGVGPWEAGIGDSFRSAFGVAGILPAIRQIARIA